MYLKYELNNCKSFYTDQNTLSFSFQLLTIVQNVWVILIFISLYTVRNKFQPVEVEKCRCHYPSSIPINKNNNLIMIISSCYVIQVYLIKVTL